MPNRTRAFLEPKISWRDSKHKWRVKRIVKPELVFFRWWWWWLLEKEKQFFYTKFQQIFRKILTNFQKNPRFQNNKILQIFMFKFQNSIKIHTKKINPTKILHQLSHSKNDSINTRIKQLKLSPHFLHKFPITPTQTHHASPKKWPWPFYTIKTFNDSVLQKIKSEIYYLSSMKKVTRFLLLQ